MRILLIQPNSSHKMVGYTSLVRTEPLALEIIAAAVSGHEVKILDLRVDPTPLEAALASFRPQVIGTTGYTTDVPRMKAICREVKELDPEIITVVGGVHASLCPQDFQIPWVDVIVIGEGESTFRELIQALESHEDLTAIPGLCFRRDGESIATRVRIPAHDLDSLPLPARYLTDQYREHYHFHFWENPYVVETARGCPFRCTFCSVWMFHQGKCRFRTPEKVLEDLERVKSDTVCFVDDNFLQNVRRAEHLHHLIKEAGIKARYWMQARADTIAKRPDVIKKWAGIGLSAVLVGFEKFRQEELVSVNKRTTVEINERAMDVLHRYGVDMWGSFIVDPQWSKLDFEALIDYVRRMKICFPTFTILTPLPGTIFFQEKLQELVTMNYELFDFLHTVLPTALPIEEFYSNMASLYANTTMGWGELKKRIKAGKIPVSALQRVRDLLKDVTSPEAYLRSLESS
ncbi:MAG: cobalamin B12-binding domain-containing protein [Chloroflexi bacterium]|nr:cobalamin B12-binding domain-containing protein [Chloroflexota bacterium]